jgi:predicted DNA-binding ribbon-helix-helix protein
LCGSETWTLQKVYQKYLESTEMWFWKRMKKINWTDRVRNEEVLHRVKEERNITRTIKGRKGNWIGHILRVNCLSKRVSEGKTEGGIEMRGGQGRRRKQLLDDPKTR